MENGLIAKGYKRVNSFKNGRCISASTSYTLLLNKGIKELIGFKTFTVKSLDGCFEFKRANLDNRKIKSFSKYVSIVSVVHKNREDFEGYYSVEKLDEDTVIFEKINSVVING